MKNILDPVSVPAVDTAQIQALDSAHFLHPFTDFQDLNARGAKVIPMLTASISGIPKATAC